MDFKEEFVAETTSVEEQYLTERNKPMPSKNHSKVQSNIIISLGVNYEEKYDVHSELTLLLNDWKSVPDLSIFPSAEYNPHGDEVKVTEAPLGVVEILSPKQTQSELILKAIEYFKNGVKSVWIVFPELENVYVFTSPDDYEMYRKGQILKDVALDIELEVSRFFK